MTVSSKRILCKEMKVLSEQVYNFIDNVPSVQEESITEYLMWQWSLLDKKVKFVKSKKLHTKVQEAKTGSDLEIELWIITSTTAIPFLIQAKKIIVPTKSYCRESLNYNVKKPIRQYQLLIDTAIRERKIPLYAFYTKKDKHKSIYISDAYEVKKLAVNCSKKSRTVVKREDILDISTNIISLFCSSASFIEGGLNLQFEVEFNMLPNYVKFYLNNSTEYIHSRDVAILDLRQMER
jgi:phage-related protein